MAIQSFAARTRTPLPGTPVLLVDTSFILSCRGIHKFKAQSQDFVKANLKVKFCFNTVVRLEVMKTVRRNLIIAEVRKTLNEEQLKQLKRNAGPEFKGDLGKFLIEKGNFPDVEAALKGKFRTMVNEYLGPPFVPLPAAQLDEDLDWEQTMNLMENYGCDSADTSILNFAKAKPIEGLVSTDCDFAGPAERDEIELFTPGVIISKWAEIKNMVYQDLLTLAAKPDAASLPGQASAILRG